MKENEEKIEVPELSEDIKKKLEELKVKLEKFKDKLVKDKEKNIVGIALLPPKKEEKNKINVLILVDSDKEKNPILFMDKTIKSIEKMSSEVDNNIIPKIISLYDLRESCYDGKYELLRMIAMSVTIYDPSDLIAALRITEVHKVMVIKKFEKYVISYVGAGSLFRGEKSNDIDVYIIIDDTDVKRMSRFELRDKLRSIILAMGEQAAQLTGVQKQFHVQTYILTDFWESIKDAHPVIFTLLRDGIPLYDRGVFMPWKILLQSGRIRPSQESINMQMDIGEKLIERTKYKMMSVVTEELYNAILSPAQAALMMYGIAPPTPKETIELLDKIFVKQEKLLEKKYVDILEKIRKYYKDIEHRKIKEVSGKDIDDMLKDADEYLKRIRKLFTEIQKKKDEENVNNIYDSAIKITKQILDLNNIKYIEENILNQFKKVLDQENLPIRLNYILKEIIDMKKEYKTKKLTTQEIEKVDRDARMFMRDTSEYLGRKNFMNVEKAKKA